MRRVKILKRAKGLLVASSQQQKCCSKIVSVYVLSGLPLCFESEVGGLTPVLTTALTKLAC